MAEKLLEINLFGACVVRKAGGHGFEILGTKHRGMFALLEPALAWNGSEVSYPDIAQQLAMTTAAVQQAVKRMRQRFRKLLEQEISETVDGPEAMAEERDHLIRILSER